MPRARLAGLAWVALLCLASPALAQPAPFFGGGTSAVVPADSARDAELDALAAELGQRFRCMVCDGQSVTESSAQLAREMLALIRQQLDEGKTPEEIEAFFVASYGEYILLMPRAEGVNLIVYLVPAMAFIGAFLVVGLKLRGQRAATGPAPNGAPDGALHPGGPSRGHSTGISGTDRDWLDSAVRGDG